MVRHRPLDFDTVTEYTQASRQERAKQMMATRHRACWLRCYRHLPSRLRQTASLRFAAAIYATPTPLAACHLDNQMPASAHLVQRVSAADIRRCLAAFDIRLDALFLHASFSIFHIDAATDTYWHVAR